jgi:sterol desaturase/sphingolipid hydroxylase (fatty acid hydroxylase superfamily)
MGMSVPLLVRTVSYLAIFFVLLFFEWLAPYAGSEQKKPFRVFFHLSLSIGNSILLYFILNQPIVASLSFVQHYRWGIAPLLGLQGGWEIFATVIAFDFWDYWMHLANHKIAFLWRFHKAHHSDMEIDVTTAARFHLGELVLSGCAKCLMIFVWGPSLWGLVAFDLSLNVAAQFHHSNLNLPFKIQDGIEKMIVTPRMHRCHHALHRDCFNTNFTAILSVWDRLFKSYHWARDRKELDLIGLSRPRGPETMKVKPFLLTPFVGK